MDLGHDPDGKKWEAYNRAGGWVKIGTKVVPARDKAETLYKMVTKILDPILVEVKDCAPCEATRNSEEVCKTYQLGGQNYGGCKFFEHSVSLKRIVDVLKPNFYQMNEVEIKEAAITYMRDVKKTYPLGKPNGQMMTKHDYKVGLYGKEASKNAGKMVAVSRDGESKKDANSSPAHHYVYMGYRLLSPAAGGSSDEV